MKTPKLAKAMEHIDDDLIAEAVGYKPSRQKKNPVRWVAMAACMTLILGCGAILLRNNGAAPDPISPPDGSILQQPGTSAPAPTLPQSNQLLVNEVTSYATADMDVQVSLYPLPSPDGSAPDPQTAELLSRFRELIGVPFEEFLTRIPDAFLPEELSTVSVYTGSSANTYDLHDFVLECKTETGGEAKIALSPFGAPCRDYFIAADDPAESLMNGIPLVIYRYQGAFLVQFSHENLSYDIETGNITLEELETLLNGLLGGT